MLQAGAIVTGSFLTLGDRVELHARLVDIESGSILAARRAHFKRRFFIRGRRLIPEPTEITPLDAMGGDECVDWAARADRMEEDILPLKARYWASRIRKHGLSLADTALLQTKTLSDPSLRRIFAALLHDAVRRHAAPLTPAETRRFVSADSAAFILQMTCRGGARTADIAVRP